jgi:Spy/CpxP family protein refolding chaperone
MKIYRLTGIAMLLSMLALAAHAGDGGTDAGQQADKHGGRHGDRMLLPDADPARMVEHMSRWLDLDDTQKQELQNVALAAEPGLTALRKRGAANREAIMALDTSAADYAEQLQTLATESGAIATELTVVLGTLRADIHTKLTAEQQAVLAERTAEMRERFQERAASRRPGKGK